MNYTPPKALITLPLKERASGEQRNNTSFAISSGVTHQLVSASGMEVLFASVTMMLGAMAFAVIPVRFTSSAMASVSDITPLFETA
jgi:hypothetical protein